MHDPIRRLTFGLCLLATFAHASAGEPSGHPRPIIVHAGTAVLPVGAVCRVELRPKETGLWESATTNYEGAVLRADDDSVRPAVTEVRSRSTTKLPAAFDAAPWLTRHFNRSAEVAGPPREGREEVSVTARDILKVEVVSLPRPSNGTSAVVPASHEQPAEAGGPPAAQVTILASPSIVPAGPVCRVETVPKRTKDPDGFESDDRVTYTGEVLSSTDAEIVIKATEAEHVVTPLVPAEFAKDPEAKRLFKTSGVTRRHPEGKEVSVPASEIRTVTISELPSPVAD